MTRWLVLLLLAAGAEAYAQPDATSPTSGEARAYLERGVALYDAGAYARAIAEFDRGLRVEAHPSFHYARGQAYRKLGDCPRAKAAYRAYLEARPPEELAAAARLNLERCPAAPLEAPPPPRAAWYRDRVGGALAGAGVLGLGAGTTFLVLGERTARAANRAGSLAQVEVLGAKAGRQRTIGAVCLAAGSALAIGAAVRYALVRRSERSSAASRSARTILLAPQPDALVVSWGGWF